MILPSACIAVMLSSALVLSPIAPGRAPDRHPERGALPVRAEPCEPPFFWIVGTIAEQMGIHVWMRILPQDTAAEVEEDEVLPACAKDKFVRAWVNGKPLYEDEFVAQYAPDLARRLAELSPTDPEAEQIRARERDRLIDQELLYQEGVGRLIKLGNLGALRSLRQAAEKEHQKQVAQIWEKIRDGNRRHDEAKLRQELDDMDWLLKRRSAREFIAGEFMKSLIVPKIIPPQVNAADEARHIKEYYDSHLAEFRKPETVQWQDVFIAVSDKHPTPADARRHAKRLIARARKEGFDKLLALDEGDSQFRGGMGIGCQRGEISPPEVEEPLLKLREGQVGPVVEMSSGVHIIRLVKHDPGGLLPFDEEVQTQIRQKLREKLFLSELKRLVRDLRQKAEIRIEE